MPKRTPRATAESIFRKAGGILRTRDALARGVHPRTLYDLRDTGRIEALGRGTYHLVDVPVTEKLDAALVAARSPKAVLCLISALEWHGLTTQVPRAVQIALPPGARAPRGRYPAVRAFRFSGRAYREGVERHSVDGLTIKVYGAAKTVADCFKFRNRIGIDVALEALRDGWRGRRFTMDEVWRFARICRVERIMRPYLESLG
ncbi:MAG: type IV toxin-antitoxin system AbiEi family antitoxin domain-containing protein [Gemmatimonadetes bacterium]|nr:type IV toxin-antitoxin system AbiEi family antitoxin domain-containing protein [Gemmatimonadota bacterium]